MNQIIINVNFDGKSVARKNKFGDASEGWLYWDVKFIYPNDLSGNPFNLYHEKTYVKWGNWLHGHLVPDEIIPKKVEHTTKELRSFSKSTLNEITENIAPQLQIYGRVEEGWDIGFEGYVIYSLDNGASKMKFHWDMASLESSSTIGINPSGTDEDDYYLLQTYKKLPKVKSLVIQTNV